VNRSAGLLEEALAAQGLRPAAVPVRGRANARLGNALAIARWLRGQPAERAARPLVSRAAAGTRARPARG
ncbi:MAG: hypothetical protein ACK56S_11955, partial [Planctomycetota bacterium]